MKNIIENLKKKMQAYFYSKNISVFYNSNTKDCIQFYTKLGYSKFQIHDILLNGLNSQYQKIDLRNLDETIFKMFPTFEMVHGDIVIPKLMDIDLSNFKSIGGYINFV